MGLEPFTLSVTISLLVLAPLLLLRSFRELSCFSSLGLFCILLVTGGMLALVCADPTRSVAPPPAPNEPKHRIASWDLPASIGLYALACSGHSSIPSIWHSMRHPSEFKKTAVYTFAFMLVTYVVFTATAYYYFGSSVQDVISTSFRESLLEQVYLFSPLFSFSNLLALSFAVLCLVVTPVYIMAQQQLVTELLRTNVDANNCQPNHRNELLVRYAIFALAVVMGIWGS